MLKELKNAILKCSKDSEEKEETEILPDTDTLCIYFEFCNLVCLHGDEETWQKIQQTIEQRWTDGIISTEEQSWGRTFKLNGYPLSNAENDNLASYDLLCHLFVTLDSCGWEHVINTVVSCAHKANTLVFRRNKSKISTFSQPFVCVSSVGWDKLYISNCDEKVKKMVKSAVRKELIYKEWPIDSKTFAISLKGNLWKDIDRIQNVVGRRIILDIIQNFQSNGYKLHTNLRVRNHSESLFFRAENSGFEGKDCSFFILSLFESNRIRLIDANQDVVDLIRNCIQENWYKGLTDRTFYCQEWCSEFQLRGCPWSCSGKESNKSRLFLNVLFEKLLSQGWSVHCTLDVSRGLSESATFVLCRCNPVIASVMSISPIDVNLIKIAGANKKTAHTITETIKKTWEKGIEKEVIHDDVHEIAVKGPVWWGSLQTRNLLTQIFATVQNLGYTILAAANIDDPYSDGLEWEPDTWFFVSSSEQQNIIKSVVEEDLSSTEKKELEENREKDNQCVIFF